MWCNWLVTQFYLLNNESGARQMGPNSSHPTMLLHTFRALAPRNRSGALVLPGDWREKGLYHIRKQKNPYDSYCFLEYLIRKILFGITTQFFPYAVHTTSSQWKHTFSESQVPNCNSYLLCHNLCQHLAPLQHVHTRQYSLKVAICTHMESTTYYQSTKNSNLRPSRSTYPRDCSKIIGGKSYGELH